MDIRFFTLTNEHEQIFFCKGHSMWENYQDYKDMFWAYFTAKKAQGYLPQKYVRHSLYSFSYYYLPINMAILLQANISYQFGIYFKHLSYYSTRNLLMQLNFSESWTTFSYFIFNFINIFIGQ